MRKLGRYEILGEIATGGMAEILLGRLVGPSGFERVVVIKRILPHLAKVPEFVTMFLDEARTVARLRHPNVVQVHELGEAGDELYLVMEYLEGESVAGLLRRLVSRGEKLDPWLAMYVVAEACRGLHAAHDASDDGVPLDLVHRDVSPQNLFVTYTGEVKVLDFGIAKAADRTTRTEAGQVKGKFAYMSPEQCAGKALDRRSDVFALGTVLWELLTGHQLFKRPNELATLKAICEQPIPAPSSADAGCPPELDEVVLRALSRSRDARTPTAAELRRELLTVMGTIARGRDPEEELAATMRRLFAERIEDKREMLSRARTASSVGAIPDAESDLGVDVPAAEGVIDPTSPTGAVLLQPAAPPPRRNVAPWTIAGALTVAAIVVGTYGTLRARDAGPAAATAAGTPAGDVPPSTSVPAAPPSDDATATAAIESSQIVLHVASSPPGARVLVDGRDVGTTPVDTQVPRGEAQIEVVVARAGFRPFRQAIVPAVDQRLFTTLEPAPRATPPPVSTLKIEKLP